MCKTHNETLQKVLAVLNPKRDGWGWGVHITKIGIVKVLYSGFKVANVSNIGYLLLFFDIVSSFVI